MPIRDIAARVLHVTRFKWDKLSGNTRVLFIASFLGILVLTTKCIWRWLIGSIHYYSQYLLAATGYASPMKSCQAVKLVRNPWNHLDDGDWFFLQKCMGSDMGLMRQDEFFSVIWELIFRVFDLTKFPGIFLSLGFAIWIPFYAIPWLHRRRGDLETLTKHYFQTLFNYLERPSDISEEVRGIILYIAITIVFYFHPRFVFYASLVLTVIIFVLSHAFQIWNKFRQRGPSAITEHFILFRDYLKSLDTTDHIFFATVGTWSFISYVFFIQKIFVFGIGFNCCLLLCIRLNAAMNSCHHSKKCTCYSAYRDALLDQRDMTNPASECTHIERGCTCFDDLGRIAQAETDRADVAQAAAIMAERNLQLQRNWCADHHIDVTPGQPGEIARLRGEVNRLQALFREQDVNFTQQPLLERLQREAITRDDELERVRNLRVQDEARHAKIVDRMRSQANIGANATTDIAKLNQRIAAARLKDQEKDVEMEKLRLELETANRDLNWQKTLVRKPCEDSNLCRRQKDGYLAKISDFEKEIKDNHLMIDDAARELGMNTQGLHLSLRQLLSQVVLYFQRQQSLLPEKSLTVRQQSPTESLLRKLQIKNDENVIHIARLEDEVLRRGGNLNQLALAMRPGLSVPFQRYTYHQATRHVFEIYEKLHDELAKLQGLYAIWNAVPNTSDKPVVTHYKFFTGLGDFPKNEKFCFDLVVAEISRLFSRLLFLREDAKGKLAIVEDKGGNAEAGEEILLKGKPVMVEALSFLDSGIVVDFPPYRLGEDTLERRHIIWAGMFQCVRGLEEVVGKYINLLQGVMNAGNSVEIVPRGDFSVENWPIYPPNYTRKTSYESLVQALQRHEIYTVHSRMAELLNEMNRLKIPGSSTGPSVWPIAESAEEAKKLADEAADLYAQGRQWYFFWDQNPLPGSPAASRKVFGTDGWIVGPHEKRLLQGPDKVWRAIEDINTNDNNSTVNPNFFISNNTNNNTIVAISNNSNSKNNDSNDPNFRYSAINPNNPHNFITGTDLVQVMADGGTQQRSDLKKERKRLTNRITQLTNLMGKERIKLINRNVYPKTYQTKGNFLNLPANNVPEELTKYTKENMKLYEYVLEYQNDCKRGKVKIPKWPDQGGTI